MAKRPLSVADGPQCDGARPKCTRCMNNDLCCHYDVAEGVSRSERIKLIRRDEMTSKLDELERVVNVLRSGSDDQASNILARLRLGERVEDVASSLPSSALSSNLTSLSRYQLSRYFSCSLQHVLMATIVLAVMSPWTALPVE